MLQSVKTPPLPKKKTYQIWDLILAGHTKVSISKIPNLHSCWRIRWENICKKKKKSIIQGPTHKRDWKLAIKVALYDQISTEHHADWTCTNTPSDISIPIETLPNCLTTSKTANWNTCQGQHAPNFHGPNFRENMRFP